MADASPYLNFRGNCADAMRFYHKVLGGKLALQTHGEAMPPEHVTPAMRDKVLHARLDLDKTVIMASDGPEGYDEKMQGFAVSLNYTDAAEARRVYDVLSEGGTIMMKFEATFWSPGFGMFEDRFGTPWMVNTDRNQ